MSACRCDRPLLVEEIDYGVRCLWCGHDSRAAIVEQLARRQAAVDQIDARRDELVSENPALKSVGSRR